MITIVTETNFQQEVENFRGRILIEFHTPTNPWSHIFEPILKVIAIEQGEGLKIVKIDTAIEEALVVRFGITTVPTFLLIDGGKKKAQITGVRSTKDFEKWLAEN